MKKPRKKEDMNLKNTRESDSERDNYACYKSYSSGLETPLDPIQTSKFQHT